MYVEVKARHISLVVFFQTRVVVGGPAGPAMAWPLFLPRKFILVFFAF